MSQDDRAKDLILYISELSENDEYYSATKLNKLLYFADVASYRKTGKSISGRNYIKEQGGPMVKDYYPTIDSMKPQLVVKSRDFFGHRQDKPVALDSADPEKFTKEELDIISHVIAEYRPFSATQISLESHNNSLGWQVFDYGEEIPYETSLISTRPPTKEEYEFPQTFKFDFKSLGIEEKDLIE